jgi:hypothetical protein
MERERRFLLAGMPSDERRFVGGRLVDTSPEQLISWLSDYGINLSATSPATS